MGTNTSAGAIIAITATAPATFDQAGYDALTPTTIGEIMSTSGQLGRIYNLVSYVLLAQRATVKKKGSFNEGSLDLDIGRDVSDAGQVLLNTAVTSDNDHYFKITLQSGDKLYFPAQVMSAPVNIGGADDLTKISAKLEITYPGLLAVAA